MKINQLFLNGLFAVVIILFGFFTFNVQLVKAQDLCDYTPENCLCYDCSYEDWTCQTFGNCDSGGPDLEPYNCPPGTHADQTQRYPGECCRGNVCHTGTRVDSNNIGVCNCRGDPSDPETQCDNQYYWFVCVPDCSATAPTSLSYNTSDQTLTWTAGTGGTSQRLYVSADPNQIANNCTLSTSPGCVVSDTNVSSPYSLGGALSPETAYYAKVLNYNHSACSASSGVETLMLSCSFTNPSINVIKGDPPTAFNLAVNSSGAITSVTFASSDPGVAAVTSPDTAYVYSTTVSGVEVGSTTVTSDVYFGSTLACTANGIINVFNPYPWWQVVDGNIHADSGGISSQIPYGCGGACRPNLITGTGGLLSFNGSASLGYGTISQDGSDWQATTVYKGTQTGFAYFKRILSDDPDGIGAWDGGLPAQSGVYSAVAGVTIAGAWNIGAGENFVLLADGDVSINADIDVAPGGFLAIIASGDINIDPAVTNIEGVLITDGTISTGFSNVQLTAEGIFTGWTGFNLQRDLDDDSLTPSEVFVYRPDLQLNAYKYLMWLNIDWKEVAP